MPSIMKSVSVAAGATATPLAGDQYEFLPFDASVQIAVCTTAAGVEATVYSGSDLLLDSGAVPIATGTPKYPDDYFLNDVAAAGEKLSVRVRNTTAGALTVYVYVQLTPI